MTRPETDKTRRILLLNASPRVHGLISQWMETFESTARQAGFTTECLSVARLEVAPCAGCMTCRASKKCIHPDDGAQRVLRAMQQAGIIIIGSPCYWGNMPGQLKALFDRIVYGLIDEGPHGIPRPRMKGKQAVIVTTCTTPWPFNILLGQSQGTVKALRGILKWSGIHVVATIQQGGTRHTRTLSEKEHNRCRQIIKRLKNRKKP
mgnify:FL=1